MRLTTRPGASTDNTSSRRTGAWPEAGNNSRATLTTTVEYDYDDAHRAVDFIDAAGNKTTTVRDAAGRVVRETIYLPNNTGSTTPVSRSYAYDGNSNLTGYTDRNGLMTSYSYDALNRKTGETWLNDPNYYQANYTYGPDALTATISDPAATYDFVYDHLGNTTEITYDPNLPLPTFDLGQQFYTNGDRQQLSVTSTDGQVNFTNTYRYNVLGEMTAVQQLSLTAGTAGIKSASYHYIQGRLIYIRRSNQPLPASGSFTSDWTNMATEYTYDPAKPTQLTKIQSSQVEVIDSSTIQTTSLATYQYAYDSLGRVTGFSEGLNPPLPNALTYIYDGTGQLVQDNQNSSNKTLAYDVTGAPAGNPDGSSASNFHYDSNLNRVDDGPIVYSRPRTLVSEGTLANGSTAVIGSEYTYDAEGNRQTETRYREVVDIEGVNAAGSAGIGLASSESSEVVPAGEALYRISASWPTVLLSSQSVRVELFNMQDNNSVLLSWLLDTSNGLPRDYTYAHHGNEPVGWQVLGKFTLPSGVPLNMLRLRVESLTSGQAAAVSDLRVEQLVEQREYHYDFHNRLTSVVTTTPDNTLLSTVSYVYEVFDRRIAETVLSYANGAVSSQQRFYWVYDGANAILQYALNASTNQVELQSQKLFGAQVDELLAVDVLSPNDEVCGNNVTVWPLADRQGSVRDLAKFDPSSGVVSVFAHYKYDAFGKLITDGTTSLYSVAIGAAYTGREYDPATGLYYYRARFYDAANGLFISEDPLGLQVDSNPYRYTYNSPTNFTDPSGNEPISMVAVAAYVGWTGFMSGLDTLVEGGVTYAAAWYTNDYSDADRFSWGMAYGKHFAVNVVTAGLGSKLKWAGKGTQWVVRKGLETFGDTAVDVYQGREWDDALLANSLGNVGGDLLGRAIGKGASVGVQRVGQFLVDNPKANPLNYRVAFDPATLSMSGLGGVNVRFVASVPRTAVEAVPDGVIYLRIDRTGGLKPYVGQSMSWGRYLERQHEHVRAFPNADFGFQELGRVTPGMALNVAEESWIRQLGGPTNKSNPLGLLSNKRYQVNDIRYRTTGGNIDKP